MSRSAIRRPGSIVSAILAGVLLALTSSVAPARADTPATGQIVGTIRDHGRPVAGATVEAVWPEAAVPYPPEGGGPEIWPYAITDAAGRFKITGVPPRDYFLRTRLPGGWMVQWYPATEDWVHTAVSFTVTAGKTVRIDDSVAPHASVSGRVVTNRGAPAGGALVKVGYARWWASAVADEQGRYLVDYLQAGDLSMKAARAAAGAPSQDVAGSGMGVIVPLVLDQRSHFDVKLWPVGKIIGKYLGPRGLIAAGVAAYVDGQVRGGAQTSADGTYTLWLWPGDYKLHFDSISDNRDQWATGTMDEADAQVFTVREDAVIHHDEHTLPTGKVGGRVLDYTGAPLDTPTTVRFFPSGDYTATNETTTDSAGHWSIDVPPGTYTVEFVGAQDQLWANDKLSAETADPIVVGPGTTTTLPDARYHSSTDLIVNATLDGTPVDTFCVTLEPASADEVCTDSGMAYFASDLPVGTYQVTVVVPDHPPAVATVTVANHDYQVITVPVTG